MNKTISLALLLSLLFTSHTLAQQPTFFSNVNVFDGEKQVGKTNVLIADGTIHAIGNDVAPPDGATVIDGTGKTLMPGMIDCHTHVWFESHLESAAVFGVTTELDMMSSPENARMLREQQSKGKANHRADYFSAGAAVTVKDGHGTQFGLPVPVLDKAENAAGFVKERVMEGSDFIKLIHEDGSPYGSTLPTLSSEMFEAAVIAAHANKKLAVSHVSTHAGATMAFEKNIDGLVHLFANEKISDETIALAKRKKAFVVPTASVISNTLGKNQTKLIINDKNLASFLNNQDLANLATSFPNGSDSIGDMETLNFNIKSLLDAGVPILAGTDSPNPGTAHGASMHMELRMLVAAGLSNEQALAAATSLPAKHFQLIDRGKIGARMRADLILVEGDPTADIKNVAKIVGVWKAGNPVDRQKQFDAVKAQAAGAKKEMRATENKMISDFESDSKKATSNFGAGWILSTDTMMGGSSTAKMEIVDGGPEKSKLAMRVTGKTQSKQPAFAGVLFSPGKVMLQPSNLSAHPTISFWAKGNGDKCELMFFWQKRGMLPSSQEFIPEREWKKFTFKISDFDNCDGTDVTGVWFGRSAAGEFEFQLDQIQLEK